MFPRSGPSEEGPHGKTNLPRIVGGAGHGREAAQRADTAVAVQHQAGGIRGRIAEMGRVGGIEGLRQELPAPTPCGMATLVSTWSAVWLLPGAFTDVPEAVTVNGVPL